MMTQIFCCRPVMSVRSGTAVYGPRTVPRADASIAVERAVVIRREHHAVEPPHVVDRPNDVLHRGRRAAAELPRESLDPHLADAEALEHRLDGDLGADEGARRLQIELVGDPLAEDVPPG